MSEAAWPPSSDGAPSGAALSPLVAIHRASAETGAPALALTVGEPGLVLGWVNAAAAELLTVEPAQVLGACLDRIGPAADPADEADWRAVVAGLVRRGGGRSAAAVRRADHQRASVWVEVGAVDDAPGPGQWLVRLSNGTDELIEARDAAAEAEHRFEALARQAPVGIFVSDVGLRLGYVNTAFSAMTGRSAEALLGTGWIDLVHPGDLAHLYQTLELVLGGAPADLTIKIQPVSDGPRWVQIRLAPVTTPRRSAGFIGTIEDITARRAWEEQLAYQASHDPLTGLANRRRLIDTLSTLLDGRRTGDRRFAVLFCDLDGFKAVNDTLGHDAGDRVLIEVAKRLASTARDRDLVARVAGDEFVVVLQGVADGPDAETAARRHLAALCGVVYVAGQDVALSASLGVAFPTEGDSPESLLRAADRVMYQAKASGHGRLRLAEVPDPDPAEQGDPRRGPDAPTWSPPAPRTRNGEEGPL